MEESLQDALNQIIGYFRKKGKHMNHEIKPNRQKKCKIQRVYMLFFAFGLWTLFIPLGFADVVDDLMSAARVMKFKAESMAMGFRVDDVEGKRIELDDFRGKVVLLDFWATW